MPRERIAPIVDTILSDDRTGSTAVQDRGPAKNSPRARDVRRIAVIVVTYNSADHIDRLLNSIPAAAGALDVDVVVVDNNSSDATWERLAEHNGIRAVAAGANIGFAAGINLARRHLDHTSQAIAILNPDLVLMPGALERLSQALADPGTGLAAPKILDEEGSVFPSQRREPRIVGATGEALFGSRWASRPLALANTVRRPEAYAVPGHPEWVSGACLLIASDCDSAVGPWDESFFLYSEETDFARRVRAGGYRLRFVPEAVVMHVGGASGSSTALAALMSVNCIRDYERHHNRLASGFFRAAVALRHLLRSTRPDDREVLGAVLRRSSWASLPAGEAREA